MRICDLLDPNCININATVANKEQAINELVELVNKSGCLSDKELYKNDVFLREEQVSTGLGEGVAVPHAKSAGVKKPGLAAMIVKDGIDFDSLDGKPTNLFFMIASPEDASNEHLDVLARLSTLLISEEFRKNLLSSTSVGNFLKIINDADETEISRHPEQKSVVKHKPQQIQDENNSGYYDVVAVTACPAGLSHTYMAAEALEKAAQKLGIRIKIETDGAAGNRNSLLPEEISKAKGVIVAADRIVEMERFLGKPLIRVGVIEGIKDPEKLIKSALDPKCAKYQKGFRGTTSLAMKMYRHLMSGLTYIMPIAAASGILSATAKLDFIHGTQLEFYFDRIGYSIGTLLFPILSAFIAFSIKGRTALVAGFTGGVMADLGYSGVIGAVINGFIAGVVALLTSLFSSRFLKGHDAVVALLIYPLVGCLGTATVALFFTNIPANLLDEYINMFITSAPTPVLAMLGAILAGMMACDLGGPINKIAYAIGVLLLADCLPDIGAGSMIMAAIMAGGMVPPLAAGLAGILIPQAFSAELRKERFKSFSKGLVFVTEGVMPYMSINEGMMRLACVSCSAITGALSMYFGCHVCAPHGGIFIIFLSGEALSYLLSILTGTICGMFFISIVHLSNQKLHKVIA